MNQRILFVLLLVPVLSMGACGSQSSGGVEPERDPVGKPGGSTDRVDAGVVMPGAPEVGPRAPDDAVADAAPMVVPEAGSGDLKVLAQYTDVGHGLLYAKGFVYSVNYADDTVLVFDASTYAKVTTIGVGTGPTKIATDGNLVFVLNGMAGANGLGDPYISVIDPATNTVVHSIASSEKHEGTDPQNYPTTTYPSDLWTHRGKLYVTFPTNAAPDVRAIDIGSWSEHVSWAAGSGPAGIAAAGSSLFVVNLRGIVSSDDDALLQYKTDGTLEKTYETKGALKQILEASGKIWVGRTLVGQPASEALVIDPQTQTVAPVAVGSGPAGLAVNGDRVYVMCQYAKRVEVIDAASLAVLQTIDLSQATPALVNPRGIAVAPSGDIYIESDGMISVYVPR